MQHNGLQASAQVVPVKSSLSKVRPAAISAGVAPLTSLAEKKPVGGKQGSSIKFFKSAEFLRCFFLLVSRAPLLSCSDRVQMTSPTPPPKSPLGKDMDSWSLQNEFAALFCSFFGFCSLFIPFPEGFPRAACRPTAWRSLVVNTKKARRASPKTRSSLRG